MSTLETARRTIDAAHLLGVAGRVRGVRGDTLSVGEFPAPLGAACSIRAEAGVLEGRVIGFTGDETLVMPIGSPEGIRRGCRVTLMSRRQNIPVGQHLLGRVLDGFGRPMNASDAVHPGAHRQTLWPAPIPPLSRPCIQAALPTGVRAIDALLTVGKGQRMGVFAGSGMGKTSLLGMIARGSAADVTVIALIGERGREVREFVERQLPAGKLESCVIVASTSDDPPLVRVQAAAVATAVAEYFRDTGADVLLLVDSLTRLASAQREIGLAAGEPPAGQGYTPSVFSLLPRILERSGRTQGGSITAFYTALLEAENFTDPICETVRSVTDGHLLLAGKLTARGHWPAVDVLRSVSRIMPDIVDDEHLAAANAARAVLADFDEIEEVLHVGAYESGSGRHDASVELAPRIHALLRQRQNERGDFAQARRSLLQLGRHIETTWQASKVGVER